MTAEIRHKAIVTDVGEGFISVKILSDESDCAGCTIAAFCSKGEEVRIACPDSALFRKGQSVNVVSDVKSPYNFFSLSVVQLAILIGVLSLMLALGIAPEWAVAASVIAMCLWYVWLRIRLHRSTRKANFRLGEL